ncbi:hypothetical protein FCOIX_4911 [Fusarium coicis]|nr:hypothetical protein FCOIX_4911 [Fusarium coicis]
MPDSSRSFSTKVNNPRPSASSSAVSTDDTDALGTNACAGFWPSTEAAGAVEGNILASFDFMASTSDVFSSSFPLLKTLDQAFWAFRDISGQPRQKPQSMANSESRGRNLGHRFQKQNERKR